MPLLILATLEGKCARHTSQVSSTLGEALLQASRLKSQRTMIDSGLPRVTASSPSVGSCGTCAGHADAVLQLQRLYAATDEFVLCGCCATLKRRPGGDARNLPYLSLSHSPQSAPDRAWSGWARSHAALKPRGASGAAGGRFQLTMSASHCLAGRRRSAGHLTLAPHIQLVEITCTYASSIQPAPVRQRQYPSVMSPPYQTGFGRWVPVS